MELSRLVEGLKLTRSWGDLDVDIQGLHYDSRKVKAGDLFVAIRGNRVDGHRYMGQAVEAGAAAVISEEVPLSAIQGGCQLDSGGRFSSRVGASGFQVLGRAFQGIEDGRYHRDERKDDNNLPASAPVEISPARLRTDRDRPL